MKLIYLDQSFLSSAYLRLEQDEVSILNKIIYLKNNQKIRVIISAVHSRETVGFSEQYIENRKKLWREINNLAEGNIAADIDEVFIEQQRRAIDCNQEVKLSISDIGLKNINNTDSDMKVVMNNQWLQRMHEEQVQGKDLSNQLIREIYIRQLAEIRDFDSDIDCLSYIRMLWIKAFQKSINNLIDRNKQILAIEKCLESGNIPNFQLIESTPLDNLIKSVLGVKNYNNSASKWLELLKDTETLCPVLKILTAFEADQLFKLKKNPSSISSSEFHTKFGYSRLNDICHISTFLPYVDILTTDKNMHKCCQDSRLVANELAKFPCKIFSKNNFSDLDNLLNDI